MDNFTSSLGFFYSPKWQSAFYHVDFPKCPKFEVTDSEKDVKDRLSSLPESSILHILSFLPTDEAVRTMLVSKSFSSLWTLLISKPFSSIWSFLPRINLDWSHYRYWKGNCNDYDSRFCEFIRYVLKHHKRPKIDLLRVYIGNMLTDENLASDLRSCIDFALCKQVKTLDFIFYVIEPRPMLFNWPSVLISDSLVELRELEIQDCYNLNELSFAAPNAERLKVNLLQLLFEDSNINDFDELFLSINCPNLKSLELIGRGYCVEIINLSSIVDVTFDLECETLHFIEIPKIIGVLKTLLCAKYVSFSDEFVTNSFFYMLKQASHVPRINWKAANFICWLTKKYIHRLDFMLRNSPHLEELVIDFTIRRKDISELIEVQFEDDVLDKEDCWMGLQSVILHNVGNTSYPVLVSFTKLLLKKAPGLNQLMFYYLQRRSGFYECSWTIEKMTKFENQTSKFSKAFPNVKISYIN